MLLNYEYHQINEKPTLIFIHGLFGSLSNLGMLAREFSKTHNTLQVDVRNHGKSGHLSEMNYTEMAQDVLDTLKHLNIDQFILVGHSMGGKIAMKLADLENQRIQKLIVLDISPFTYLESHHTHIFKALFAVKNANINSRHEAISIMKNDIDEDMVIQFLLKSFSKGEWLFNVDAIYENYMKILAWDNISVDVPTLFLRGGNSPYIAKEEHISAIHHQFKNANILTVENTGHWLHAEKTIEVIESIKNFIK
ncbi:alpha/beta fold hydrolase [Acinetobacter equi]|uniref:Acyl-CoA esterase n=1 Tax=Acinetobacter equi TaxID=1324350 RepID=A0A0N9W4N2_9GAMM|nr:alpha/beta fold hydrolase [Acinetobacter equi]ALH96118.1 acyl-CoA esterase [Acinetobacter equi]